MNIYLYFPCQVSQRVTFLHNAHWNHLKLALGSIHTFIPSTQITLAGLSIEKAQLFSDISSFTHMPGLGAFQLKCFCWP